MSKPHAKSEDCRKNPNSSRSSPKSGDHVEPPPPEVVEPDPEMTPEEAEQARKDYLLTRFWISAADIGARAATGWRGCSRSGC